MYVWHTSGLDITQPLGGVTPNFITDKQIYAGGVHRIVAIVLGHCINHSVQGPALVVNIRDELHLFCTLPRSLIVCQIKILAAK